MITKQRKTELVQELIDKLKGANGLYLLDFARMTVDESIKLRRAFKAKNIAYKVAKNTLAKIALMEYDQFNVPDKSLFGMTAFAFGYDDPTAPAKVLKEYLDQNKKEIPVLKCAIIDGQLFDGNQLKLLASLPSKEDMIAGILGSLDAPVSGIVGSINAVVRDLASVIEEVAKKKAA